MTRFLSTALLLLGPGCSEVISADESESSTGGTGTQTSTFPSSSPSAPMSTTTPPPPLTTSPASDSRGTEATSGATSGTTGSPGTSGSTSGFTSQTTGSTSGSTGSTSTTGATFVCGREPLADLDSAVAVRFGDLPPQGGGGMSTTDGGPSDDNLWIRFANTPVTCEDPYGDDCEEGVEKWLVTINLDPDQQVPGVYDVEDLHMYTFWDTGTDCEAGANTTGNNATTGTLTIESIGRDRVIACLDMTDFSVLEGIGTFVAERC